MCENDLAAVLAIESVSFARPWTARHFLDELDSPFGSPMVAVTADDIVVGYICPKLVLDEAEILDVAVAPSHRGVGIGRVLLECALADCRDKGASYVALEVRASNEAARALYSKFGFLEIGRRKRYYEDGEDAVLMEHTLCTSEECNAV